MIERHLLAHLRQRASARGIVVLRSEHLRSELVASEADLSAAVKSLEQAGKLTVVVPLPFLVVKLHSWPGKTTKSQQMRPSAYSYSYSLIDKSNSYSASERELLAEILETLGERDPHAFEGAIRNYSADVIRKALDRVRRTRLLRKNRTALFRYLLTKLS